MDQVFLRQCAHCQFQPGRAQTTPTTRLDFCFLRKTHQLDEAIILVSEIGRFSLGYDLSLSPIWYPRLK
nr:expressed protein [Hymenolepis microstoma]